MSAPLSGQPHLTVAILAYDAEDELHETLKVASQLAQETLVCTISKSREIHDLVMRYGARIVHENGADSFADARNTLWKTAKGDWILWLEAGEKIDANSIRELRAFIDTAADPSRAYMMLVVVPPADNNISGEQAGRIRLVPNRSDIRYTGRVRETIAPALTQAAIQVEGLPWRILRSQEDNDPQVKLHRAARDLQLLDKEIAERGQSPELLVAVGEGMTVVGDRANAIACFRKALQSCTAGTSIQREAYYGLLTALDESGSDRQAQMAICLEAIEQFPFDAQLLCAMGGYLQAQGRVDMAARAYQTAIEYGEVDPEIWHVPDIFEIAAACLSLAHQIQNNDEQAHRVLVRALERNPSATRLRRQLIDLHVKHDRRKEALAEFDRLPSDTSQREALRSAIRGGCLASRQNWTPALAYLQTAYNAGCRDILCLRWLSIALKETGDVTGARKILQVWQTIEPRSGEAMRYLSMLEADSPEPKSFDTSTATLNGAIRRTDSRSSSSIPAPIALSTTRSMINIYGPANHSTGR